MASRSTMLQRAARRAFSTTRIARGGAAPWGTEVNEPGGRLFGEKVLAPGERRELYDWEVPYIGTLAAAAVILYFGLGARPNTDLNEWAKEEAAERKAKRDAAAAAAKE